MEMQLHRVELPLRHPFTISRGTIEVYQAVIVELSEGDQSGYGELVPSDYYGVSLDDAEQQLQQVAEAITQLDAAHPAVLWETWCRLFPHTPAVVNAIDSASYDLWGKLRCEALWRYWGLSIDDAPASSYTIGIDTMERMVAKLQEFADWPIFKIKLGTEDDLAIVRELRKHTSARFRVDANCAWTPDETIANAEAMRELGVEFIEQPLPPEDIEGMRDVASRTALPIIADESCRVEDDVDRCTPLFQGINVKLVKCGGPTAARRMLLRAKHLQMQTMIGCMTETSVGISAAAHLAPMVDYVDLDGAVLLAEDWAEGVALVRGRLEFPPRAGFGIEPLRNK